MNGQCSVAIVVDKAELSELVQKMTDPRPGRADDLGQACLIDSGKDRSGPRSPAEIRKQQENSRQAFLAEIK